MRTPRALIGPVALALAIGLGTSACGMRPEANTPIRVTGDKEAAIPTTDPTTSTTEAGITTTTYFYGTTPAPVAADETTTTMAGADSGA